MYIYLYFVYVLHMYRYTIFTYIYTDIQSIYIYMFRYIIYTHIWIYIHIYILYTYSYRYWYTIYTYIQRERERANICVQLLWAVSLYHVLVVLLWVICIIIARDCELQAGSARCELPSRAVLDTRFHRCSAEEWAPGLEHGIREHESGHPRGQWGGGSATVWLVDYMLSCSGQCKYDGRQCELPLQ